MSARALNWAWQQTPATAAQKLVLTALADRADEEGYCFPSNGWVAAKCAPMAAESVRKAVRELSAQGLLEKTQRRRRGDGTLGTWLLKLPVDSTTGRRSPVDHRAPAPAPPGAEARTYSSIETKENAKTDVLATRTRDYAFEFVVSVKGEPLAKQRTAYGRVAADLNELLDRHGFEGETRLAELERRHQALCRLWGEEKSGPRSLVEHWPLSGNAAAGLLTAPARNGGLSARELLVEAAREAGL